MSEMKKVTPVYIYTIMTAQAGATDYHSAVNSAEDAAEHYCEKHGLFAVAGYIDDGGHPVSNAELYRHNHRVANMVILCIGATDKATVDDITARAAAQGYTVSIADL